MVDQFGGREDGYFDLNGRGQPDLAHRGKTTRGRFLDPAVLHPNLVKPPEKIVPGELEP